MKTVDDVIRNAEGRVSVCRQDINNSNAAITSAKLEIARKEGMIEGIQLMIDWMKNNSLEV